MANGHFFTGATRKAPEPMREKRGLSQTQLADMAEIGRAHLSQIENGAVAARIDTLYLIAQALELTLSELLQNL